MMMLSVSKVSAPGSDDAAQAKFTCFQPLPLSLPAVLGRGPLLKCAETKVSRRHATLDWDDDGVSIQASHAAPTLLVSGGKQLSLKNGESAILKNGDLFGFLPNAAWYRINLSDSALPAATQSGTTEIDGNDQHVSANVPVVTPASDIASSSTSNADNGMPSKNTNGLKISDNDAIAMETSDDVGVIDLPNNNGGASSSNVTEPQEHDIVTSSTENNNPDAISINSPDNDINMGTDDNIAPNNNMPAPSTNGHASGSSVTSSHISMPSYTPISRQRTLPSWLTNTAKNGSPAAAAAASVSPAPAARPVKKQTKAATKKQRTEAASKLKVPAKIPKRAAARKIKKDYLSSSEDEDEIGASSSKEDNSALNSNQSTPSKPVPNSNQLSPTMSLPSSNQTTPSKSPSKTDTPASSAASSPVKAKPHAARHDISDSEKESSNIPDQPISPASSPTRPAASNDSSSNIVANVAADDTSSAASSGPSTAAGTSDRASCQYGASCYRQNPQHRLDEAHPGDPDYSSGPAADDLPECEYGTDCYRRNPQHRKQYKHSQLPQRRAKRKARAAASRDATEEGDSDSYDYDDPFLNDGSSDDYNPVSDSDSDSEYAPSQPLNDDDRRDLHRMKKEAKKFTKKQ